MANECGPQLGLRICPCSGEVPSPMPGTEATNCKDREYNITDPTEFTGSCGVVERAVRRNDTKKVMIKSFRKGITLVEVIKARWTPHKFDTRHDPRTAHD